MSTNKLLQQFMCTLRSTFFPCISQYHTYSAYKRNFSMSIGCIKPIENHVVCLQLKERYASFVCVDIERTHTLKRKKNVVTHSDASTGGKRRTNLKWKIVNYNQVSAFINRMLSRLGTGRNTKRGINCVEE